MVSGKDGHFVRLEDRNYMSEFILADGATKYGNAFLIRLYLKNCKLCGVSTNHYA